MEPSDYIQRRQQLWARRKQKSLRSRTSDDDHIRDNYVVELGDNLFAPLMPFSRAEFEQGDGGELHADQRISNMYAVHSSSAIFANSIEYWRQADNLSAIAKALKIPSTQITGFRFEAKHIIDPSFERAPNIDGCFSYESSSKLKAIGIESKFSEPYSNREVTPLNSRYIELPQWEQLPATLQLARKLHQGTAEFKHVGASQLIKHILGMVTAYGCNGFRLLYLWYAVPHPVSHTHAEEIDQFSECVTADGINFTALTYQDLFLRLAHHERGLHQAYVDYLIERYL
ncbi:MAG: hypothetical protein JNJ77_06845 [Planctomycetia bacterium]|nr:hypothetical protein [Planctomycetia bacterium]